MNPKISVIVPIYNVERYLAECLDSIISQSFTDIEIICVNDGSTDSSLDILNHYAMKDERIKIISQENMGQSEARNTGIKEATGQYICFIDSDDLIVDGAFEILWDSINNDESIQIVSYETSHLLYDSEFSDKDLYKESYYRINNDYSGIWKGRKLLVELIENDDFVESAWLLLIKRSWLIENKIYFVKGAYFEDSVFALECYFKAERIKYINEKIYIYRIHKNSIMTSAYTYQHEYWRIWQFEQCLRFIFSYAENDREINAVSKAAMRIMGNIKCIYTELSEHDKEKIAGLSSLDKLIVECMCLSPVKIFNADLEMEGMLSVIRSYNRIVLYGAGIIGGQLLQLLRILNLDEKIIGFGVSSENPEIDMKDGKIVRYIGDYNANEVELVVISACNYHASMINMAKEHNFNHILLVDHNIEHSINKRLAENKNTMS